MTAGAAASFAMGDKSDVEASGGRDAHGAGARRRSIVAGLIGRGIQLSRTPAMQESAGASRGLRLVYQLLDADMMGEPAPDLPTILHAAELCGFAGVNVTYPYKREIVPLLDGLSDAASRVGAVNTVVFRDGKRFGHNTDCWGFAESFRQGMGGVKSGTVLLVGAGGAGGAVAHALLDCGVERILVRDIDGQAADILIASLEARPDGAGRAERADDLSAAAKQADGIVNASPVGMAKLPGLPVPAEMIEPRHWAADVVYFPLETEFLATARKRGCRVLAGSGMALFQAVRAFELFTGETPDVAAMKETFDSFAS
ncbi:shikimate dehydrogenase [Jiella avicenniae]|uniref:Shikimate dehydrogenase n=1 Tax=Jiella avicenniae TaxID=2907202 RepID=A0A9X1P3F5_9HYPH|nr:shikimate dehydrogenase [Jiella avicenniae]MCE7029600.1 shikimate dehydrogenase [Jiella avicenniae]